MHAHHSLSLLSLERRSSLPPWETEWLVYGPIPNPGDTQTWPGEIGFKPLALDGAVEAPEAIELAGAVYQPGRLTSTGGRLDLLAAFPGVTGCPLAYLATTIRADKERWQAFSFGANWGTRWWVNGEPVYDSTAGNAADSDHVHTNQFCARLRAGDNLVLIRIVGGSEVEWNITLALPVAALPTGDHQLSPSWPPGAYVPPPAARDYARAGLRIEHRPVPEPPAMTSPREQVMGAHGVRAHWVGIVDHFGSPYVPSAVLPAGDNTRPEYGDYLKQQVAAIHAAGMAAMTWYPALHSRSTARAHPEWRHVDIHNRQRHYNDQTVAGHVADMLCPLTGYGQLLTNFVIESIRTYGFDGFWFDGTIRSPDGMLGCACETCRRRFKAEVGLPFPADIDWNDKAFRRWVRWRDDTYMAFWHELTSTVRAACPGSRIVVNHLHRLCHPFSSGFPLRRYRARLLAGTESQDDPFVSAFHARLQRAYHQSQAEVWMGLHKLLLRKPTWPQTMHPAYRYAHHALAAMTAGCMPSFGTPDPAENLAETYDLLARLVNPRAKVIGGEPVDAVGLLLSGQAETWHFSRRADGGFPANYWNTVWGWHNLLMEKQIPQHLLFDDDLRAGRLRAHRLVVAPFAVAVSRGQLTALRRWVEAGGCLVTSPDFASLDEWGEPASAARLRGIFEPSWPPAPDASLDSYAADVRVLDVGKGRVVLMDGNPGLRFLLYRRAEVADEVAALLRQLVRPSIEVAGPRRLHVAVYRRGGVVRVHLHNFVAYSEADTFPNPMLTAPAPTGEVTVTLRGVKARSARRLIESRQPVSLERGRGSVTFRTSGIHWGEIVELREDGGSR